MADKNLQQQAQMRENLMARWIAKHPENILLMQKDRSRALKEFQHWAMLKENSDKHKELVGTQNVPTSLRSKIPSHEERLLAQQRLAKSYEDVLTILQTLWDDDQKRFQELDSTLNYRERKIQEQQVELEVLRTKLAYTEGKFTAQQNVVDSYREELNRLEAQQKGGEQRIQELSNLLDLNLCTLQDQKESMEGLVNKQNDQIICIKRLEDKVSELETNLHQKEKQMSSIETQKSTLEQISEMQKMEFFKVQAKNEKEIFHLIEQMEQEKEVNRKLNEQVSTLQERQNMSSTFLSNEVKDDLQITKDGADENTELIEMIMVRDKIIMEKNEALMEKDRTIEVLHKDVQQQKTHRRQLEQQLLLEVDEWKAQQNQVHYKLADVNKVCGHEQTLGAQVEAQLSKQLHERSTWHSNEDDNRQGKEANMDTFTVDMLTKDSSNSVSLERLQKEEEMRIVVEAKHDLLIKQVMLPQVSYLQRNSKDYGNIFELYKLNTLAARGFKNMNVERIQMHLNEKKLVHGQENVKRSNQTQAFQESNHEDKEPVESDKIRVLNKSFIKIQPLYKSNHSTSEIMIYEDNSDEKLGFLNLLSSSTGHTPLQSINNCCEALRREVDSQRKIMKQMKHDILNLEPLIKRDYKNLTIVKDIIKTQGLTRCRTNHKAKLQGLEKQIQELQSKRTLL